MMHRQCAIIMLVALASCSDRQPAATEGIARYGLIEAPQDRRLVGAAVHVAQQLLEAGPPILLAAWEPITVKDAWKVYAVSAAGGGREQIMTTYRECHCVLVRVGALTSWTQSHVGSNEALLSVEPEPLLAYMLLHEAGHMERDTAATSDADVTTIGTYRLNRSANADKDREWSADEFAAQVIRRGMEKKGTDLGLLASGIAMALSQVGWNLQVHRSLDQFGATAVRDPAVFWDAGLSHPNLEWRIMRVNAMLSATPESQQLLKDFEEAREAGPLRP